MEWLGPTAVIGLLTVGGLYLGHIFTRRNDKDTLLLSSRDAHIDDLREDLKATRDRLDKLSETVNEQGETITRQGEQIRSLQVREWSLKRYVATLIDFIRHHKLEPPEPPQDLN